MIIRRYRVLKASLFLSLLLIATIFYLVFGNHLTKPTKIHDLIIKFENKQMKIEFNSKNVFIYQDEFQGLILLSIFNNSKYYYAQVFSPYIYYAESQNLLNILKSFPKNTLTVLISKNFNSTQMDSKILNFMKFAKFYSNDVFVFAYIDYDKPLYFDFIPKELYLKVPVKITSKIYPECLKEKVRIRFCSKYYTFPEYCRCNNSMPVEFSNIKDENYPIVENTPLAIISSSRLLYLIQCINSLIQQKNLNKDLISIFSDYETEGIRDIAMLFDLKVIIKTKECISSCSIQKIYNFAMKETFKRFEKSSEMIFLEEDLIVSLDFMDYLTTTIPYLRRNKKYYCISAWNDQSYSHTIGDPSLLYLIEGMPGLGWVLKKSVFEDTLKKAWPTKYHLYFNWDVWMRFTSIRKNRECIIPDISRTFHIGENGYSMDYEYYKKHYLTKKYYNEPSIKFNTEWLINDSYDKYLDILIKRSKGNDLDDICLYNRNDKSYQEYSGKIYTLEELINITTVIYVNFDKIEIGMLKLTSCWNIWDRDVRDFHKGIFRVFLHKRNYIVIDVKTSTYKPYTKDIIINF